MRQPENSLAPSRVIEISHTPKSSRTRYAVHVAPALVAAWGVAWIAFHASQRAYVHSLFQTLALAESVIALLLRGRKPVGSLLGILVAYLAFQLDPLLLPPLLIALFTAATVSERQAVLFAIAATATTVATLPLTGRASTDLAGYLVPRLLAVAAAATIGLWARTNTATRPRCA
jgi:hypothetical protein